MVLDNCGIEAPPFNGSITSFINSLRVENHTVENVIAYHSLLNPLPELESDISREIYEAERKGTLQSSVVKNYFGVIW